jgi:positive regulator of sigma E activity
MRRPAEKGQQVVLEIEELEHAEVALWMELHQQVDIALGTDLAACHRAEQAQARNALAAGAPVVATPIAIATATDRAADASSISVATRNLSGDLTNSPFVLIIY